MAAAIFALLAVAAPADASAGVSGGTTFAPGSVCTTLAPESASGAALARDPARWDCRRSAWPIDGSQASFVRLDMAGSTPVPGEVLITRLTRFAAMRLTVIGTDGSSVTREIRPEDLSFSSTSWTMRMPLPRLSGASHKPVAAYVLEVTGPRHKGLLSDARIMPPPSEAAVSRDELVLAALCGLMFMPLALNFAIYRVLRQPFALWHALGVFAMLLQTAVASGIVNRFASLSLNQLCLLSSLSWSLIIIGGARFFDNLLEPGMLGKRQKMLLTATIPWVLFWAVYYNVASGVLLPSVATVYYASFLPFIFLLGWTMATAALRGSRTVWFQIVGWAPLMTMGVVRITSMLGATNTPMGLMGIQHFSIAFEVLVTTLGAADRFMAIKDQRDRAITQARILESLAERDPLTGLYNRRGFEERYTRLVLDGFDTMAVLDLDHFKQINDTRGHATGDTVLRAVAVALMPDEDTVAVRLGGEEFLLLLRGRNGAERAERRRQAIPTRIAAEVPMLDRPVTASMGMVTAAPPMRFTDLYRTCDRLLYEAKAAGRNRTESTTFAAPASLASDPEPAPDPTVVNLH
ncbi:diguanylate cyclase [Novosphingobium sp. PhB165]|uniref:sensor domain-containing diguanylate cyclase n=1 Tax=Novosphingobium sp. PhB165 TaxID=2485105 RepID=UPI0014044EB6|nr:diguanylate cyclase [Novosphingobium sp. PhB165]